MTENDKEVCYYCPLCGNYFDYESVYTDSAGKEFCRMCDVPVEISDDSEYLESKAGEGYFKWLCRFLPWRWELLKRELYSMESICAWCNEHMGYRKCSKPGLISHGICEACQKKYFPAALKRYTDKINSR